MSKVAAIGWIRAVNRHHPCLISYQASRAETTPATTGSKHPGIPLLRQSSDYQVRLGESHLGSTLYLVIRCSQTRDDRDSVAGVKLEDNKRTGARRRALAIAVHPLFVFSVLATIILLLVFLIPNDGKELHFRPSSVDWSNWTTYHPVASMKALPTGTPRRLPKVQHEFPLTGRTDWTLRARQRAVRDVFVRDYNAYKQNAWGFDELTPVGGGWKNTYGGWGLTMIDALDTMFIMGLRDDFNTAAATIAQIDWANTTYTSINVFESTIRILGGLISAYDLSGEKALLQKAEEFGNMLYLAFDTPNRLPCFWLTFANAYNGTQVAGNKDPAAGPGSLTLEFTRLAQLTGNLKFFDAADRVTDFFFRTQNQTAIPGLWPRLVDFQNEEVDVDHYFTLGANSDSLYEYFPKMYALLGGLDDRYETLYRRSMAKATQMLLFKPMLLEEHDLLFSGDATEDYGIVSPVTQGQHLACFVGGMFGLGGKLFGSASHVSIGDRLARGCAWAYSQFATGIMPEQFEMVPCSTLDGPCPFDQKKWELQMLQEDATLPTGFVNLLDPRYILRPEAIESVFLLYRMTGNTDLQDLAWDMFQAITNATETSVAHSAIANVTQQGVPDKTDQMDVS